MKVVLLENIKGMGVKGDVIDVSEGHAVNFLIPQGKVAETSDSKGKQVFEKKEKQDKERKNKELDTEKTFLSLPDEITLSFPANDKNVLFTSVTKQMLSDKLNIPSMWLDDIHIKEIGEYDIIVLYKEKQKKIIHLVIKKD